MLPERPQEHVIDLATGMAQDQDIDDATREILRRIQHLIRAERARKERSALALARLRHESFHDHNLADLLLVLGLDA